MTSSVHRFVTSCVLSYRALFTWLNPYGYVSSRILFPVFLAVLFGLSGKAAGADLAHSVAGGPLLAITISCLFGMALAVGNERQFGTLGEWLAAPAGLFATLAGKVVPHVLDGLLSASVTFVATAWVLDFSVSRAEVAQFAVVAVVATVSAAGLALVVAAAVFRWRDTFTPPNLVIHVLVLCSGVLVPVHLVPLVPDQLAGFVPLHHASTAASAALAGNGIPGGELVRELLLGAAFGVLGFVALRRSIASARASGSLHFS